MNLVELKCKHCGAVLKVNSELNEITCNYCGNKMLIDDEATKLDRVENVKLKSRKQNHEQDIIEKQNNYEIEKNIKKDKEKQEWKEIGIGWLIAIGLFVLIFIIAMIGSFFDKTPKLSDYNELTLGMTYQECKDKLGQEGHLISESENELIYVWYNGSCNNKEECEVLIELHFENGKLSSRTENGLK